MFEPQSREEITTIRSFLKEQLGTTYVNNSRIWLGFIKRRQFRSAYEYTVHFVSQWGDIGGGTMSGHRDGPLYMNTSIFRTEAEGGKEPNNSGGKEVCTMSLEFEEGNEKEPLDKALDVDCYQEDENDQAYAVCEVENWQPKQPVMLRETSEL